MAENVFAIFPDSRLASGHAVKGGLARPKKTALCDVKNTLLAKKSAAKEPTRKIGQPSLLETPCKPVAKEIPVKETPGKVTSKQGGTFAIASDDKENVDYMDKCGACGQEDSFIMLRCPSERLNTADIQYCAKTLFALEIKEKENFQDPLYFESVESPIPSIPPEPTPSIEPIVFTFSDEE
ncbi:Histone-lysine N-methyltransferase, H3 lysine-9 specific [Frankliniella fusca]|uniref:Histone-lysine N-methyltransferase, H3 lysine-9 specific n=1 Tax=Frankliniella fusca TaxID=407009 RepID=A0AAE1GXT0_9NEOP|nr:Histone-lysine N-methyltransferase, H3 lysine-9 specific [Frankliniella fusca]